MIARRILLAAPLLAAPAALAQREASLATFLPALRAGLAAFGLVEGRNLGIEYRFGDGDARRVPSLAAELARLPVSVLIVQGAAAQIVAGLGLPVPLVVVISGDPVEAGLTASLGLPPSLLARADTILD
ncbi:hypothetical protein [Sediminicoccus sp. KRV36]|uniref:hypothetical protein n=1 Tax=Sediminicoccus sp. KRV36 TaxID=3133721 RepID=UPI00201052F7|nr:hypothetical protein [Sediminicoccus rosea]UPY38850.1 hypothetical protein LHU95_09180 [Sediminicoccus rosea]